MRVAQLSQAAGSLRELVRLLRWLEQHGEPLLAADVELDTGTQQGQLVVRVLEEVERWEHPAGRPGLKSDNPELVERIAALRADGLSLHAIADELNIRGVPTPRGGARWRASSVQSALGYRRPSPPPPRAPAPPPRAPRKPPRAHPADLSGPPHKKKRPRP